MARLQDAILTGALLQGARLGGAQLQGARWLTVEQLRGAIVHDSTGLDPQLREQLGQADVPAEHGGFR